MQKLHLTQAAVDKLKATSMRSVFYDSELTGFGLAIGPGGVKTWIVWHRTGKSRRRLARILLGTQPEMTADEAREIASRVLASSETAETGNRKPLMPTVAQFAQEFMETHVRPKLHPATAKSYAFLLDRVINPRIGALGIDRVTRADLAHLHPRAGTANVALRIISSMYGLAGRRWIVPRGFNPARGMWRPNASSTARNLTVEELARLGAALRELDKEVEPRRRGASLDQVAGAAVRLLLLTGLRLADLLSVRWNHVDISGGLLHVPDQRGGLRTVALGAAALRMLGNIPHEGSYVIAGVKPDKPRQKLTAPFRRLLQRAGVAQVPIHALRRTHYSYRAELGLYAGRRAARPECTAEEAAIILPRETRRAADLVGDALMAALNGE